MTDLTNRVQKVLNVLRNVHKNMINNVLKLPFNIIITRKFIDI